jgi:hypothetical protein
MSALTRGMMLAVAGGGVVLTAVVMTTRDANPPAATPQRATAAARSSSGRGAQTSEFALDDVNLELLQRPPATLDEPDRNPFRFEAKAAPAPPPNPVVAPPRAPAAPTPPQPTVPAGPPPPPPIPLRFIGLVEAPTQVGRVAIMSDGKGNVFYGKEGDTIEGRYRMLKIGADVVELAYVDGRGQQTIRLSGQ